MLLHGFEEIFMVNLFYDWQLNLSIFTSQEFSKKENSIKSFRSYLTINRFASSSCYTVERGIFAVNHFLRPIVNNKEARVALGYASSNSYASFVLSKLPKCFISRWTHSWRMNQLFHNIFNPMENLFFSRDLSADVMSVHNRNMKHARAIESD